MAGKIKGLTVEIGGDTTKLGKALENVNKKSRDLTSELGQVNKLLKMDPGNTELIAQKQKILADAIDNTKEKLEKLKTAQEQAQDQLANNEITIEQYRELQREIIATEQKLKGYENAAQQVADGNDKIAQSAQAAAEESEDLNQQLDGFATGGLTAIAGTVTAAVTGLTAAAEATREYRTAMGKLDTAFADSGHSAEAAKSAYNDLVGVLGETDVSVEAANHLAKLTDNEKDLATWTGDILPGVFATFGDSLPIEGLTEAANETAKVGAVTGPLADALNWAGVSEDKFNESLAKCNSEQERQKLIMETMVGLYGEASESYKETNADVIAANEANAAWMESMAQVGAVVEPLITEVKMLGAELVTYLVPVIEAIINNLPVVLTLLGGLTAAFVAFKVSALGGLPALIGAITTSLQGLFTVMLANPIGLIIAAITALVAGFIYLWNNCDGFREFWIDLWEKIKNAASKAVDWLKGLPQKIMNAIKGAITKVTTWGTQMANKAQTAATGMVNKVVSVVKNLPTKVWNAIKGAVSKVTTWGSQMKSKASSAASSVVSTITSKLSQLPGKVLSIGGNLVSGLWNGIGNKLGWLKSKISSFTQSVLSSIKSFFGVHSPSTETAWIGDMLDQGLAQGIARSADAPEAAMQKVAGGVLNTAQADLNGLTMSRQIDANFGGTGSSIGSKLDKILAAIESGQILTIDGDALVGATATRMDQRLGQRRALAARGAI